MHQPNARQRYFLIGELRVNLGAHIFKELLLKTIFIAFRFVPK
jgi:hypothetical protein